MKIAILNVVIGALMRLFSWITPKSALWIAPPVAAVLWWLSPRKRRVTRINLKAAYPDMPADERHAIARASMVEYVRGVFEAGMLWHWPVDRIAEYFDEPEGIELLRAANQSGRGVIIAAPHSGSWELLSLHVQHDVDYTILYKPSRFPGLDEFLISKRRRLGANLVPANGPGLRALYKVVKAGKPVGILPDQEPTGGDGEFAPFFGIETLTGVLVPRIAQSTGAIVLFAVCLRQENGRYKPHVLAADEGIYSADMRTALTALNKGIEQVIELDRSQYLWAYKRFRNRPEGESKFYK